MADANALRPTYLPYGKLSVWWQWLVLFGLGASFPGVLTSAISAVAHSSEPTRPNLTGWGFFMLMQVANKLPIAFRYTLRGPAAILDLLGFLTLMLASAAFALRVPEILPPVMWHMEVGLVGASLVAYFATPIAVDPKEGPLPLSRQMFGKSMSVLVSAPMLLALWAIAFR